MNAFKGLGKSETRGGRISDRGFHVMWVGIAGIVIGGLAAGAARASAPVIGVVLGVAFATAFVGLGIVVAGGRIRNRDLAEYHRKVEAGEIPPWKPGDPDPLA